MSDTQNLNSRHDLRQPANIFDGVYETIQEHAKKQRDQLAADLHMPVTTQLNGKVTVPLGERHLTIRWVSVPAFIEQEEGQGYHYFFFCDIKWFQCNKDRDDANLIRQQCHNIMTKLRRFETNYYTVFITGKQRGWIAKGFQRRNVTSKHIFLINENQSYQSKKRVMFEAIAKVINGRCEGIKKRVEAKGRRIFGHLKNACDRLMDFVKSVGKLVKSLATELRTIHKSRKQSRNSTSNSTSILEQLENHLYNIKSAEMLGKNGVSRPKIT